MHASPRHTGQAEQDGAPPTPPPVATLGEKIELMIAKLPPESVTLREIREIAGQDGLLVLTVFLSIVFLVPVSIPGVSTVFGLAILMIGICRLFGHNLWLPRRVLERSLPSIKLEHALRKGSRWVEKMERVSRPHRMARLSAAGPVDKANSSAMIYAAIMLMMPFGMIPFSNTLPGIALILFAIGLLQRDGLCILLGHLINIVTTLYFAALVLAAIAGGGAAYEALRNFFG